MRNSKSEIHRKLELCAEGPQTKYVSCLPRDVGMPATDFPLFLKGRILGQPQNSRLRSDALGNGEHSLVGIEREKFGGAEIFRGGDVQHI